MLQSALSNFLKQTNKADDVCVASSHTNFRYLNTPEKLECLRNLSSLICVKDKQLTDYKKKLDRIIETNGIRVDENTHNDLLKIMEANNSGSDSEECFSAIFWQQQLKAAKLKNMKQMRWHSAMIHWCLYLHHQSSGCYSTLRNSGVITLPAERTLSDYQHHSPSTSGFSYSTDMQLLDLLKSQKSPDLAKYVTVVLDEMYVREGLVFQKSSGALEGYADLGEINNILGDAERQYKNPDKHQRPLAKVMLVFMV